MPLLLSHFNQTIQLVEVAYQDRLYHLLKTYQFHPYDSIYTILSIFFFCYKKATRLDVLGNWVDMHKIRAC